MVDTGSHLLDEGWEARPMKVCAIVVHDEERTVPDQGLQEIWLTRLHSLVSWVA